MNFLSRFEIMICALQGCIYHPQKNHSIGMLKKKKKKANKKKKRDKEKEKRRSNKREKSND